MAKQKSTPGRIDKGLSLTSTTSDHSDVPGSGSARRFLKHLDRQLQRFSTKIDSLEERANRLSNEKDRDLILAAESLHRETLLLRAEIREHLAGGRRKLGEMIEYAEESWDQLRESLAELKESLESRKPVGTTLRTRTREDDAGEDENQDCDEDVWRKGDGKAVIAEIHAPRKGPKR